MGFVAYMPTPSVNVTADALNLVINSETGSAISLPEIRPDCQTSQSGVIVPFNIGGTVAAPTIVDAAPSEYSLSMVVSQRGHLSKEKARRSWFRVYSSDTRPLTDGAFGITFRQKDASGNIISVLSGTVPKNGLSAIQCLAVCFQQIVPQMTETTLLPGASTGYTQDPPVVDGGGSFIRAGLHSEYLYLPHTAPDSVWEAVYTESADFLSRFSSPNYEPGWYGSGAGQSAAFTITITKVDNTGVYLLENTTWRMGDYPPIVASIQGNDLDAAADAIATIYRSASIPTGTVVISAPSAGQRSIAVAWPANASVTNGMYAPGGPSQFIKWKALKALGAGSGVSKLYGFRVTYGERVLDAAIPTLPWPTTSIPAGGGGGGSSDTNTLLLMHFDETSGTTLADETGRTFSSSNDLSVQTGAAGKFGRGLMPSSWTAATGSSPVDLSGGIFTIEFWVAKTNPGSTSYEVVFAQTTSHDTWANGIVLYIDSTTGLAAAYIDGVPTNSSATMSLTPGTWTHVALVRQGAGAGQTKWYVNGVGGTGFQTSYTYAAATPTIGNTVGQTYGLGYVGVDELRISDMARYTADFTPPTAPFEIGGGTGWGTLPADVIFAVNAESNGNDVAQFGLSATASGTATIQASGSRTSDGYLRNTDSAQMADACFGYTPNAGFKAAWGAAQSMTLEFDIKYETGGHLGGQILGIGGGYTSITSGGTTGANINGSPFATSAGTAELTIGAWHHIAFVADYNGGNREIRCYRDGVEQGTGSSVGAFNFNDYPNPTTIGLLQLEAGFIGNGALKGGLDNIVLTTRAKYTANFTPGASFPEIVGYTPPPSNIDVTCAGYNDIDDVIGDGSFSVQATWPDAFFFAQVTLDDSTAASVFTIDGQSANFSSSRTLAAATNTGTFTAAVPMTFDGAAAADDATQAASFYADVPIEFTGDSAIEDVGHISVYTFIAPAEFYSYTDEEDATNTTSLFVLIDPVVYRLTATVPAATLVANTTQFYVDATVPAATLSAEISQYEGFKLSGTVPAATGRGWFGMRLNSDVPRVTIEAFGSVPNTLRMDKMLPRVTIDANIKDGRKFSLNANAPAATLSAWTGWQLAGMVPVATASGNIVVGGAFKLNSEVPVATGFGVISTMNVLRLNAVVPVATRGNWLALSCNVPAARLLARISAVQAITRVAYSFTLANSAMTRYPAYPFVQIIRMGNAYYGVADDGLYEIGGETDNGTSIPWSWETCMTDFGKAEKKTVVSAYLGGYVPQSMTYTIKAGDVPTGANAHTTTATAVLRNHRQKFGIGRKSRFFAFGLSATQGRVAIESIEFEVANMSRRV